MIYRLGKRKVTLQGKHCFIAPGAAVIGSVILADYTSIWFNTVLRGDNATITIGSRSNVQDGSVLHVDPDIPLSLGTGVTVGHKVMLHGCTIGDNTLIGMNSVILNHAIIGDNCIVGANTLVTEGKVYPQESLILGAPARVARRLSEAEIQQNRAFADHYVDKISEYLRDLKPQRLSQDKG